MTKKTTLLTKAQKRFNKATQGKTTKFGLTIPGKGLTVREALTRYQAGTLQEQILDYYYDAYDFPGEEIPPDFRHMTRIDQLALLADKREEVINLGAKLKAHDANKPEPTPTT
mgnify:CR=1 FL=1